MTMHWHDIDCLMTEWITVELNNSGKIPVYQEMTPITESGLPFSKYFKVPGTLTVSAIPLTIHSTYVAFSEVTL